MSLRGFHIVFIVASILLCAFCGWWALQAGYPAAATASFLLSAGLVVYGVYFIKKVKTQ
jgi:hypothetical protein